MAAAILFTGRHAIGSIALHQNAPKRRARQKAAEKCGRSVARCKAAHYGDTYADFDRVKVITIASSNRSGSVRADQKGGAYRLPKL